jgi:hypothetical protein
MKKIALILLLFVYTSSTMGIGITQFYCCGHLQSTSLSFADFTKSKSSKNHTISCCITTFKSLKLKDNYIGADYINSPVNNFTFALLFTSCSAEKHWLTLEPQLLNTTFSPPPDRGVPIYIFDCAYRI